MRKILGALLAVTLLTFVAACGASGGDDSASSTTKADQTTTTAASETTADDSSDTTADDSSDTTEADDGGDDGDTVSVDAWAEGFCGDFSDWLDTVKDLSSQVGSATDLEGAKGEVVALFDGVAEETVELQKSITDGPVPDMDDGEQFLADLAEKFQGFVDETRDAATAAEGLSTSDPNQFQTDVNDLVTKFQSDITEVGNAFGELDSVYDDADLQNALSSNCSF